MKRSGFSFLKKAAALGSAGLVAATTLTSCQNQESGKKEAPKESPEKGAPQGAQGQKNPNVVYIVLDDMGFSDWGAFGSEIQTPNIDKLAEEGLRYNNFHVCPVSSPTRASLLTGRNHSAVGMGNVANFVVEGVPSIQGRINHNAATAMQLLKTAGYSTYGIGKYHLTPGYTINPAGPFDYWPLSKGYDRYYGFLSGETDQYHPQLVNGNELIDPSTYGKDYILNDDLIAHAKQYITDHVSLYPDKPFFMDFSFGTSHSPLQVPKKYSDKYKGVYDKGWDGIRAERFAKMKELGIIPADTVLPDSDPAVKPWDTLTTKEKQVFIRFMELYAGYIAQADEKIGELVSYLKETGEYDDTIIVLINDNGASKDGCPDGTDSFCASIFSGQVPTADALYPKLDQMGGPLFAALYPKGWAQVSNTPFSGYKAELTQGGIRSSLVISWPNGNFKDKGTIRTQYVSVQDISATIYDLIGLEVPDTLNGIKQLPVTGTSIAATFSNANAPESRTTDFYFYDNQGYIYNEGWIATSTHKPGTPFEEDSWSLYNIENDKTAVTDLASENPAKLKELKSLFLKEAEKNGVLPFYEMTQKDKINVPKDSPRRRMHFKYYPGVSHISADATPPNVGSLTITIPVERKSAADQGVLVALGDNMGGYTIYIKDNKLVYEYNKFGILSKIVSGENMPVGKSTVRYTFDAMSPVHGKGTLFINDKPVGGTVVKTAPLASFEGLDIGMDRYLPVSRVYAGMKDSFAFSGTIAYAEYDWKPFIPKKEGAKPKGQKAGK